ncbi:hypothetical protein ACOSQ4_023195 [Xanthoceras sorbifolium]
MGDKVGRAVLAVLNDGALMEIFREDIIVLIPKVKVSVRVRKFKTISLCNITYKLIAKMLANRLRGFLENIISPNQSAFVLGRLITDNMVVGFECLHSLRGRRQGKMGHIVLKLDMNKAYNRVEWGFISGVMKSLGFNSGWIDSIMKCVSLASYFFLLNDEIRGKVIPNRGLRHGYPLSLYLLLLCVEELSTLIYQAKSRGVLHSIKVAWSAPVISHLLFVDDSLVFAKTEVEEYKTMLDILKIYNVASGQSVNFDKSVLSLVLTLLKILGRPLECCLI